MNGELIPVLFANLCGGFFVILLLAIGIYLVIFSRRSKQKAQASQTWPRVTGTINVSEARTSVSRSDDGDESVSYYPAVEYTYAVGDQSYTGKKISFGGVLGTSNPADARKAIQPYPAGSQAQVYYNPQDPSEAVLERQAGGAKWALVVGIILLVLSVCIACPLAYSLISRLAQGLI